MKPNKPIDFPNIKRDLITTLQVNLGYKCNQTCVHCHVNAGPFRKEMMDITNLSIIPEVLKVQNIDSLDLTGGAPELHPGFRDLVEEVNSIGVKIIDRCNLTILTEPGFESLAEFLANNNVTVVASLPCYEEENVDKQRGNGVFKRSIYGLKKLNKLGYGMKNSNLILNLVYNPQGAILPPNQNKLENSYKKILYDKYNIKFNSLFTIANMPIKRFASYLRLTGELESYRNLLINSHNSNNLDNVMCKKTISVDWEGKLYDCDFNQQLNLSIKGNISHLKDLINEDNILTSNPINVDNHCYGCTAGSGSSCGGSLQ